MNGGMFHFTLEDNLHLTYARVLESNYNGLGQRYDENDKIVPKYVVNKIKDIATSLLKGTADWQK